MVSALRPDEYISTHCRLGEHDACAEHTIVLCACGCHVVEADGELRVGSQVYARNQYLGTSTGGFRIAEVLPDGYLLRRTSDGVVFPEVFAFDDVQAERRKDPYRTGKSSEDRRQFP